MLCFVALEISYGKSPMAKRRQRLVAGFVYEIWRSHNTKICHVILVAGVVVIWWVVATIVYECNDSLTEFLYSHISLSIYEIYMVCIPYHFMVLLNCFQEHGLHDLCA
ncbi:hypothetical protein Droror1_Dr00018215 [Drosera rotundifolia]